MLQAKSAPELRGSARYLDEFGNMHAAMSLTPTICVKGFVAQTGTSSIAIVEYGDMIDLKRMGGRLKALRNSKAHGGRKIAAAVVADAVGISRSHLAEIENGTGSPSLKTLGDLATYYNVPVTSLLSDVGLDELPEPADQDKKALLLAIWQRIPAAAKDRWLGLLEDSFPARGSNVA